MKKLSAFTCLVIVLMLPLDLCFCFFFTCFTVRFFPFFQSMVQPVHLIISGPWEVINDYDDMQCMACLQAVPAVIGIIS